MKHLDELIVTTNTTQQEDDLPDFLAARIFEIADRLRGRQILHDEIEELIEQVVLSDTYGQTGYIGMGVNHLILEGTICRLEEKLKAAGI